MLILEQLAFRPRELGPLTLSLEMGQVVLLCGPSGSGKTTLCGLLTGELEATAGSVQLPPGRAATMMSDAESQLLGSTVAQELALGAGLGPAARAGVANLALSFQERGSTDPHTLSPGEQQLLLLASLSVGPFSLLILDEGLSLLDQAAFDKVCAALQELAASGALILVVSHETRVLPWVDRCVGLVNGQLFLDKPALELRDADLDAMKMWRGAAGQSRAALSTSGPPLGSGAPLARAGDEMIHLSAGRVLSLAGVAGSGKGRWLGALHGLNDVAGWSFVRDLYSVLLPVSVQSLLWRRSVAAELELSAAEGRRRGGAGRLTPESLSEIPVSWRPRPPRSLSQGQAKLVAILCLLLQQPELLLLEEPFSGLDAALRASVEARLREYLAVGGLIVLSTHDAAEALLYGDQVLWLEDGRPAPSTGT